MVWTRRRCPGICRWHRRPDVKLRHELRYHDGMHWAIVRLNPRLEVGRLDSKAFNSRPAQFPQDLRDILSSSSTMTPLRDASQRQRGGSAAEATRFWDRSAGTSRAAACSAAAAAASPERLCLVASMPSCLELRRVLAASTAWRAEQDSSIPARCHPPRRQILRIR